MTSSPTAEDISQRAQEGGTVVARAVDPEASMEFKMLMAANPSDIDLIDRFFCPVCAQAGKEFQSTSRPGLSQHMRHNHEVGLRSFTQNGRTEKPAKGEKKRRRQQKATRTKPTGLGFDKNKVTKSMLYEGAVLDFQTMADLTDWVNQGEALYNRIHKNR